MKKILLSAAILIASSVGALAQNTFEGTITYSINFENSNLPPEALAMFKGSEAKTFIKGDHRRMDMNMGPQNITSIADTKSKGVVTLMDIMGQKYLIRMSEADLKKEEAAAPAVSIKYVDETKTIAGYKCKKALVTTTSKDGKTDTFNVWYTEEIPGSDIKSPYKGLKGVPLEYTIDKNGMKISFTATSVTKDAIPDSKFEIPSEGYTETTMEDLQKSMGKMGSH